MKTLYLTHEEASQLLSQYDVIVPSKRNYYIETLYSHYANTLHAEHLDVTREIITEKCGEFLGSFDAVMKQSNLTIDVAVPNRLEENAENQDLGVSLKIESMADFSPDNIAKQVPQLNKLLELREALLALKGPMGNIPAFRNKLQELIADPNAREALEKELAIILEKE